MAHEHHDHDEHEHHHGASPDAPIACVMSVFTPEQRRRHNALTKKLRAAVVERRELDNGYALKLADDKISDFESGEWMLLDSKCCPFLEITIDAESGARWLRLSGRPGVKEFLKAEMGL